MYVHIHRLHSISTYSNGSHHGILLDVLVEEKAIQKPSHEPTRHHFVKYVDHTTYGSTEFDRYHYVHSTLSIACGVFVK